MATRFYLPSVGAHAFGTTGAPLPAFDAGWTATTGAFRRRLIQTPKEGSAYTSMTTTKAVATNPANILIAQFVAFDLQAQTIANTGTWKGIFQAFCGTAAVAETQIIAKVLAANGSTSRGTLFAMQAGGAATDAWNTTQRSAKVPLNYAGAGGALTQVVAQDMDMLVIEVGARMYTASTSIAVNLRLGDNTTDADLAENETSTSDLVPWIEFSQSLLFWNAIGPHIPNTTSQRGYSAISTEELPAAKPFAVNIPLVPTKPYVRRARDTGAAGVKYVTWGASTPDDAYPGVSLGTLTDFTTWKL